MIEQRGTYMKRRTNHNVLEQKIYDLIREDDTNTFHADLVDGFLMILVVVSVVVAFLSTFELSDALTQTLSTLETVFVVLFSVEYVVRVWTAELIYPKLSPWKSRLRYMLSPMAIIDCLSILPFYLPLVGISVGTLKAIRLVRLLRIFKINRYTNALTLIGRVLKTRASQLLSSILVIFILIFIASMLMYDVEHKAQPEVFNNAFSAMWWAMSTITTVGYGDIYPITTAGRIISAFITFLGIGLTAIPTGIISAGFIEQTRLSTEKKSEKKPQCYCSQCGHKLDH